MHTSVATCLRSRHHKIHTLLNIFKIKGRTADGWVLQLDLVGTTKGSKLGLQSIATCGDDAQLRLCRITCTLAGHDDMTRDAPRGGDVAKEQLAKWRGVGTAQSS